MFYKMLIVAISLVFWTPSVFAGPGKGHSHSHEKGKKHDHEKPKQESHAGHEHQTQLSEEILKVVAKNCVIVLAKAGTIDKAWEKASLLKLEKMQYGEVHQWRASYKTEAVKESGKETLYIFLEPDGKYVAGNFTGK